MSDEMQTMGLGGGGAKVEIYAEQRPDGRWHWWMTRNRRMIAQGPKEGYSTLQGLQGIVRNLVFSLRMKDFSYRWREPRSHRLG